MDTSVVVALVAAGASLAVAVLNAAWGWRNQRSLADLQHHLSERKADRDARRDYEYDARKRLYNECEPLFFQMHEAAENALHRIVSLARTSRLGHLGESPTSWISRPGYYAISTIYNLLVPLAIFKLLQRRLTLVDLTVDPVVRGRYELMKWLYLSYTDDFEFARLEPRIAYDPHAHNSEHLRQADPVQYWKQGIPYGYLDNAVESLAVTQQGAPPRCMSFGEFERAYHDSNSTVAAAFGIVADQFLGFDPRTRPVLWRILIAQAHLSLAIIEAGQMRVNEAGEFRPLRLLSVRERHEYDWRRPTDSIAEAEVHVPFDVADAYFRNHLPHLLEKGTMTSAQAV